MALQRALSIVQTNRDTYVALLFYASWCPFSKNFTPNFHVLSDWFPAIHHFAFEESIIRPRYIKKFVQITRFLKCNNVYMVISESCPLQYTIKAWSAWFSNPSSTEFHYDGPLSRFTNHEFPGCLLQSCHRYIVFFMWLLALEFFFFLITRLQTV